MDISIPNESMIYDLSRLTPLEQKKFVERFNHELFEYQIYNGKQWYFCIYEEAHQYFPQGCLRARNMQFSVRLLTQGRNFRISMALITQFSSMLDKDTMKFMNQRFFGTSNEPNDIAYLKGFLGSDVKEVMKLDSGDFLYFNKGKISKIGIKPYNSTTPKIEIMHKSKILISEKTPKQTNNSDKQALFSFLSMLIYVVLILSIMH